MGRDRQLVGHFIAAGYNYLFSQCFSFKHHQSHFIMRGTLDSK